jgi:methylation protein EvaC
MSSSPQSSSPDAFLVEIGSNDGVMLRSAKDARAGHLGFAPCGDVARKAMARGLRVVADFDEAYARDVAAPEGRVDVSYAANAISHIPDLKSVFEGLHAPLAPDGVIVFEDPYLGDVIGKPSFDQIYDEHFYRFSAMSVRAAFRLRSRRSALPCRHGREVRYTLAWTGSRRPTLAVHALLVEEEEARALADPPPSTVCREGRRIRHALVPELDARRRSGRSVIGYGARRRARRCLPSSGSITRSGSSGTRWTTSTSFASPARFRSQAETFDERFGFTGFGFAPRLEPQWRRPSSLSQI